MKRLVLIICFLQVFVLSFGQTPKPEPPVVTRTTVDPLNQHIHIYWSPSPSPDVTYYQVEIWQYGSPLNPSASGFKLAVVPADTLHYEYIDNDVTVKPLGFLVTAHTDVADVFSNQSNIDSTIFLKGSLDECKAQLKLSWNINPTWKGHISMHKIYIRYNNGPFFLAGEASGSSDSTVVTVRQGGIISAHVVAMKDNAAHDSASSQRIDIKSNMADIPTYINADYGTVDNGDARVGFTIDPLSGIKQYNLVRSKSVSGPFEIIQTYNSDMDSVSYTDNVNTSKDAWYYRLIAVNECGNEVDSSNIAGTVLLQVKTSETDVSLNWTPYQNWITGVKTYEVQRKFENGVYSSLSFTNNNSFQDHINTDPNQVSVVYYKIIAQENPGNPNSSVDHTSVSNIVRVELNPNIRFNFDAFIPGSATNNSFYPARDFMPQSYSFKIFNRWGNLVFETTDPDKHWYGNMNGKTVEQGVYMWEVRYSNSGEKPHVIHGTVTVIIP